MARGLVVTKSTISRVSLDEDKAVGKGWDEEVVFTGAEQLVEKESEGEPIPVSYPVKIWSKWSKMCCNMF